MKNLFLCLLAIAAIILTSCEKDVTYKLDGKIINTYDRAIKSSAVELRKNIDGAAIYSTTTDNEGNYSFTGVDEGSYVIYITATGYGNFYAEVSITADHTQNYRIFGNASVYGHIINSQTGYGLPNATISFTFSSTNKSTMTDTLPEHADFFVTTDYSGYYYTDSVPFGLFCAVIRAANFTPRVINGVEISSNTETNIDNITLVENVPVGSLRFILSWGETPYDLDSHLTGPLSGSSERFHCYYSNHNPYGSDVNLDVDDTYSYGPETTTIELMHNGMYRFSVYNYSNSYYDGCFGIYNSPAVVELWDHTGLVRTFSPNAPLGNDGNTWQVCEVNVSGTSYSITTLNTYVYSSGSGSVTKSNDSKKNITFNVDDF